MKIIEKKTLMLSFGLACMMLLSSTIQAQGLFGRGATTVEKIESESLFYDLRGLRNNGMEWMGGGMIPQDPTQEAPLGNGLLVFVAAVAGYVIVKSKGEKEEQL